MIDKSLLTFEEATHTYRYNGVIVPGVTSILKPLSQEIYKYAPERNMNFASGRGSDVHKAIEFYSQYEVIEIESSNRAYLDAYIKFSKDYSHISLRNEYSVYSDLGYAGTLDNIGRVDGEWTLIDYKTTSELHKKMVGIQLSAYRQALLEEEMEINQALCLQLKKDGKYKPIFYSKEELDNYFEMFKVFLQANKTIRYILGGK